MRGVRHNRVHWRWLGLTVLVLALLGPASLRPALADSQVYVLDVRGDAALVLLLPDGELARREAGQLERLGVQALSARYLPGGDAAVVDFDFALWRLDGAGLHPWLPPGSVNAPLFVSPDGRSLAYLKPLELLPGSEFPLGNAIAVLDLDSSEERVLLEVDGITLQLYGWVDSELAVYVPNWTPAQNGQPARPADELVLARLSTAGPNIPIGVAVLPAVAPGSHFPQTSFDQHYLAYTSANGVIVANLTTGEFAVYPRWSTPWWTEAGLTAVTVTGTGAGGEPRALLPWSPTDLVPAPTTAGPVRLPQAVDASDIPGIEPLSASAILFYRPVPEFMGARPIRVSAYFDLDSRSGFIRDWTDWTGTSWQYGHAYDGHNGTDYDGVTGDPVYIAAPGTVFQVSVDCNNYWPGGPGSFGTHVRMNHGTLSDGNSYLTIYGHLMCTGVQTSVGAVYTSLPSQIGLMGNTGWSSGDHLHLEVRRNGQTAIDPYDHGIIGGFPPPMGTIGDVQGVVREPGGAPAAGARVKFFQGGEYHSALTGPDGYYRFNDLDLGALTLMGARGARFGTTSVTVAGGALTTAPDLVLSECAGNSANSDGCPTRTFDAAAYVADVTVPDPAVYAPNAALTKTWRLRNTGTTTWGPGYHLVFIAGDQRGSPLAIGVPSTAPGAEVDLSTALNAPAEYGMRRGYWRLRNPQGVYFGSTLWVEVNVAPASPFITFAANPPSPSAASTVHLTATVNSLPNFRAVRLLINGAVAAETTNTTLTYAWNTSGLPAIEHSLTIEAATHADPNWLNPERRGVVYALQGAAGALGDAGGGASAPSCTVAALPSTVSDPSFAVSWGASGGTGGIAGYEVQFLDSGRGPWRTWISRASETSGAFTGQLGHTYAFRCRATDNASQIGAFSASGDTQTMVGAATAGPNLRIAGFTVAPNPAGGLWARLTIENNGTASTGRGFFADLYNQVPAGPGNFTGSVHMWVSEPLAAGATRTLEAQVTQASGQGNVTLYALVDSTGAIAESNEGDNVSSGVTQCLAAADAYENDNSPAAAKPINPGTSQARTIGGPGDQDWMRLGVSYGRFYALYTSNLSPNLDTRLRIVASDGQSVLSYNDDGDPTTRASALWWSPPAPGDFFALVDDWHPAAGGCSAGYTIALVDAGPGWVQFFPLINR